MNLKNLINGEKLINNTRHTAKTSSVGFCFLDLEDYTPEYALEFLSGIVDQDICVIFETNIELNKSFGFYADPYGSFFDSFDATEYCITEYDNTTFKMIKYSVGNSIWKSGKWKWFKKYDEKNLEGILYKAEKEEIKRKEEEAAAEMLNRMGINRRMRCF